MFPISPQARICRMSLNYCSPKHPDAALFLYLSEPDLVQQAIAEDHSEAESRDESDDEENEKLTQGARVNKYDNGREHQDNAYYGYEPFHEATGLILFHSLSFPKSK